MSKKKKRPQKVNFILDSAFLQQKIYIMRTLVILLHNPVDAGISMPDAVLYCLYLTHSLLPKPISTTLSNVNEAFVL